MYPAQNDFPANGFMFDPSVVMFNTNSPPMVNVQSPYPELQQMVPAFAAQAANESARLAASNNNAARIYTFNQLAYNNFNNSDFIQVIITALDIYMLGCFKRNNFSFVSHEVCTAVDNALAFKTAYNLVNKPHVSQMLNQHQIAQAQTVMNAFQNTVNEITMMKNHIASYRQNVVQQPMGGSFQPVMANQFGQPTFQGNQFAARLMPERDNMLMGNQITHGSSERSFVTKPAIVQQWSSTPTVHVEENDGMSRSYSTGSWDKVQETKELPKPDFGKAPVAQQVQPEENLSWTPSGMQPHPLSYDPNTEDVELKKINIGGKMVVVQVIVPKENMDRNLHTPPTFEDVTPERNNSNVIVNVIEKVEAPEIRKSGMSTDTVEDYKLVIETDTEEGRRDRILQAAGMGKEVSESKFGDEKQWTDPGSLSSAIQRVRVNHSLMINRKTKIRREFFAVPKVFVCKHNIKLIAQEALYNKNFKLTALYLRKVLEDEGTTHEQRQFVYDLNNYLTFLVNELLCDGLSLPRLWIDDFKNDVVGLVDGYLEIQVSPFIQKKFLDAQEDFYLKHLTIIDNEERLEIILDRYKSLEENEDYDDENGEISIVAFERQYSISCIDINSKDMPSNYQDTSCAHVVAAAFPSVLKYCEDLDNDKALFGYYICSHLVITSDGKVYKFFRSPVVGTTYLFKEFDPYHLYE